MLLFIDPAQIDKTTIALVSDKKIFKKSWPSRFMQSETLLIQIKIFFRARKISWQNISKIAVVAGPGPFSRIRTGVAMANALALALDIPVIPVSEPTADLYKIQKKSGQKMIKPAYGKPAHITYAKNLLGKYSGE